MITTEFGDRISARVRAEHEQLATRWFERLVDLLPVTPPEVFPSSSLLDHIPELIRHIGASIAEDHDGSVAADAAILEKAQALGALRHGQRASLHQVLREYQILGGVLLQFISEEIDGMTSPPPAQACVQVVARIHHAVDVLSQTTVEAFVALYMRTIAEQTERLDQFTRMATHEWRQPLGALHLALGVLRRRQEAGQPIDKTLDVMDRNLAHLVQLTDKLETMARLRSTGDDTVVTQTVSAYTVVREAARQLREMADAHGVDIRVTEDMPVITVDVGRLELALVNLISNAIKYADPAKQDRYVDIAAAPDEAGECRIRVQDNGVGIPSRALGVIFQRFTRVPQQREGQSPVEGVGLGLSIVDDCVRAMKGRLEVASTEGVGSTFTLCLPVAPSS
jgi:signal transduction histidine kinase